MRFAGRRTGRQRGPQCCARGRLAVRNIGSFAQPFLCFGTTSNSLTERYSKKVGKKIKTITKRTLDLLRTYDWPGNIRELQNVVERAVILSDGETFSVDEAWLKREASQESHRLSIPDGGLSRNAERERALIEAALAESGGGGS